MFSTGSNPIQLSELTGKVGMSTVDKRITHHIKRENELSYVSLQKNGSHICGGARLNYKHVLITKICSEVISDNYHMITAVLPALHDPEFKPYGIENIQEIEKTFGTFFLLTVSIQSF